MISSNIKQLDWKNYSNIFIELSLNKHNYEEEIHNLLGLELIENEEVFNFKGTPLEDIFEDLFQFGKTHLISKYESHGLNECFLYFNNYSNLNAKATKFEKTNTIQFSLGLIKHQYHQYLKNRNINEFYTKNYLEWISQFDIPITLLTFQIATQFIYYHEFAHLLQFGNQKEKLSHTEQVKEGSQYKSHLHKLEYNADTYATLCIGSHLTQFYRKIYGEKINVDLICFLIKFFNTTILSQFISLNSVHNNLYYRKYSHPHPFIRSFTVILHLINYVSQNFGIAVLDSKHLFSECLKLYKDLEKNKIFETNLTELIDSISKEVNLVSEYVNELMHFDLLNYQNAIDIWNKNINA